MKRSKTDQLGIGQLILLQSHSDKIICPVRSLQCWLSDLVRRSRPLFQHESGLLWIQYQFGAVIWKLLVVVGFSSHKYSMHSLRIGAVSNAAVLGFSPLELQRLGHWRPTVYKSYVRTIYGSDV